MAAPERSSQTVTERRSTIARAAAAGEIAVVRAHLTDADGRVRAAAFAGLVRAGDAQASDGDRALADPDPLVRKAALELGAALPSNGLVHLLDDPDAGVVEAAAFAIGEVADLQAVPALIAIATDHADPLARESAIAALGALGDARAIPALLSALGGPPAIRRRAVVALAAFEDPAIAPALRERLTDRDWQVRQAAEEVLRVSGEQTD
jgi:HEAT repeat protein